MHLSNIVWEKVEVKAKGRKSKANSFVNREFRDARIFLDEDGHLRIQGRGEDTSTLYCHGKLVALTPWCVVFEADWWQSRSLLGGKGDPHKLRTIPVKVEADF
jgi:hypothetical protein